MRFEFFRNGFRLPAILLLAFLFAGNLAKAQFTTPTVDAAYDGAGNYPNTYTSGTTNYYLTWNDTDLFLCMLNANETEPVSIFLDVDPIVPVNGGTDADGTRVGIAYDGYTGPPNLPFRADILIYAHNGYRELFRRNGTGGWTSLGGGNDGICGGGTNDYTGNANGQYSSNNNGNGAGGDDRREFRISWSRLLGTINSGARPASFNWMGYVSYNNGMYAQVPVENYNGNNVNANNNGLVRYFTVSSTANGSSTNPFSRNSYTQPLTVTSATFGGISVYDFTMNSSGQSITRTTGAGGAWTVSGNLVVAAGTLSSGSSTNNIAAGNVDIRGGTLTLSSAAGGDLNVSGNFTKTSGTFNCNSRSVNFNGTTKQIYSSNATENINFLNISNVTDSVVVTSNINIPAPTASATTFLLSNNAKLAIRNGATLSTNSAAAVLGNWNFGGTGTRVNVLGTLRNTGTTTANTYTNVSATTLLFGATGVYEHNFTTTGGTVPTSTWATGSTCAFIGYTSNTTAPGGTGQTFSNLTYNCPSQTSSLNFTGGLKTVNGTFRIVSTGSGNFRCTGATAGPFDFANYIQDAGSVILVTSSSVGPFNFSNSFTLNGGTFDINSGGSGTQVINFGGNWSQTGGTFQRTSSGAATITFNKSSGVQTISQTAGTIASANTWNVGSGSSTNTLQFLTNVNFGTSATNTMVAANNATIDFQGFALSGSGAFTASTGSSLITSNANGINSAGGTGSVLVTGTKTFTNTGVNYTFNGSANAVNTGTAIGAAATIGNLTFNNTFGTAPQVTLGASSVLTGTLTLTSGIVQMGANNLTINTNTAGAVSGGSSTAFLQTNSTGQLRRAIATAGLPITYNFPIGTSTNYTPASFTFSANSTARNLHVRTVGSRNTNDGTATDYINNRYWVTDLSVGTGTYSYTSAFTYLAGDVVGTIGNIRLNRWGGALPWTQDASSSAAGTTLSSGSLSESTGNLAATAEWAGRVNAAAVTYTWTGATSSDWGTAGNWTGGPSTPTNVDNVIIPTSYTTPLAITGTRACLDFEVQGTGTFSMGAGSSLTVGGNLTYSSSVAPTFDCTSTFALSAATSQTVPAFNYGNLTLTGGNRVLASSGTIGICGTYTPSAGTTTTTGSTVNFNGTGAQTIAAASYNNLTISNNRGAATLTSPAGTIAVGGTFDVSTLSNYTPSVNASSIFDFTAATAQTIPAFFYGQLNNTGNGARTWASSGIIDINQGFTPGSGTHTITGSTIRYSNTAATTWNLTSFTTNVASRQYNNLIFAGGASTVWSVASALTIGVNGDLTLNSGALSIGAATAGTLAVDGTTTMGGGTLNVVTAAGNGTVNLLGNLVINSGTITKPAGAGLAAINFAKASGTQTVTQAGGTLSGAITWGIGTGTTSNTVQLLSNLAIGAGTVASRALASLDFQTFVLSGAHTFTTVANTTLISANTGASGAFTTLATGAFGSVQSTVARTYTAGTNFSFTASSDQSTGNGVGAASVGTLTVNTTGGARVTLTKPAGTTVPVTTSVNLLSGILILNQCDLQMGPAATFTNGGTFSASNMVATINTARYTGGGGYGRIQQLIPNGTQSGLSYTFPLGDITGTAEYSPVTISNLGYTGATGTPYISFRVYNTKSSFDPSLNDYLNRHWSSASSSIPSATGISFNATFTYVPADVVGTEANIRLYNYTVATGTWANKSVSGVGNVYTVTGLTGSDIFDNDFTGRPDVPPALYFRTASAGPNVYESAASWLVSTDPNFVSPAGVTPSTYPTFSNSDSIRVMAGHTIVVAALAPVDNMRIDPGATMVVNAGANFAINNGTGTDVLVGGTVIQQSANAWLQAGTVEFTGTALYNHNVNGGTVAPITWYAGSECRITGSTNSAPAGLTGQTFSDFTWACTAQSASLNLSGSLSSVARDLNVTSTNGFNLGLVASAGSLALSVGRDINVSSGFLILTTGTITPTATVTRDLNISGGGFTMVSSASNGAGTATMTVGGNVNVTSSAGTALILTASTGTGAKAATMTVTGTYTLNGTGTVSLSQATNTAVGTLVCNSLATLTAGTMNVSATSASASGVFNANAGLTINGATLNGSTLGTAVVNIADNQALTLASGNLNIAPAGTGTINVGTNTTAITSTALTLNGGSLLVASGGTGNLNMYGDVNLNAGTVGRTGGTGNMNFVATGVNVGAPHLQTITQTATTFSGTITLNVGASGTSTRLLLGSDVNFGIGSTVNVYGLTLANFSYLDFSTYTLTSLNFNQLVAATLVTANPDGFWTIAGGSATGSVRSTATRSYNAAGNYSFNGSSAQVTGDGVSSCANLSVFNANGLTLSTNLSASGVVYLNFFGLHGKLFLSNFNLTMAVGASFSGQSAADYVVTNGTGYLSMPVSTSAVSFPVGNSSYNPITLTPGLGTNVPYRVRVIDAVTTPAPNDATKLINRYWSVTAPTASANTLSFTGQWNTGEQNANYNAGSTVKVGCFTTLWSDVSSSQVGSNPYTSTGGFALTAVNLSSGVIFGIGKDDGFLSAVTTYTWLGSVSSDWTVPGNWNPGTSVAGPTSTDNVIINAPGTNVLNITGTRACTDFTLDGNGTFTMGAGSQLTVNGLLTYTSSGVPTFDCSSTFFVASASPQVIPAFAYGNLNGTGGDRTLSSGTVGICGTFTPGGGTYTTAGNTVDFNGTGAQTIPAFNYNGLTISNNRGGATLTLAAGVIDVAGSFTPSVSNYTPSYAGNTINFSGAAGQAIPAFTYFNITSANNSRVWANSGVIDINNTFTPGTGVQTITGSTVRYSSTSATTYTLTSFTSNVASRHYNNLELVGGASTNWDQAPGFNLGVAGTFTITGAGTFRVTNGATANTFTVDGASTIGSGTMQVVGPSASAGLTSTVSMADLTLSGTGVLNLDAASNTAQASVTVNNNLSITSTATPALNFGSGTANANNTLNLKGNLTKSGTGTIGLTGTYNATALLNFNGTTPQTWNHSGAAMSGGAITVASGSTLQLASNLVSASSGNANPINIAGILDCQGFAVQASNATNTFALNATGTIRTSSASGLAGAVTGFTAAPTFAAGGTFEFTGTGVNTGFAGFTGVAIANQYTLTWAGTTSLTLDKSVNLSVFNFTNSGLVFLGNFDIFLPSSAGALTGSGFGVTKMFVTNGTGSLSRAVLSSGTGLPFTWPIGESTGTTEYSPVTVNSIASAGINGTIAFRVVDGVQPNNSPASSYISRYWPATVTGFNVGYTLSNLTFTYDPSDIVVGPEASLKGNSYSTTLADWTQYASSSCASNVLTITSGVSGSNMPTNGTYDITARIDVPVYYRTVAGGPWQTLTTWEVSSDPLFISPAGATPGVAPNNLNSEGITIRNGHAVTTASTITVDDMVIESGGTMTTTNNSFTVANGTAASDLIVNSGGTLAFASASNNALVVNTGALIQVDGLMQQSGSASPDVTNNGTINIGATGTYQHARNAGIIPTCTWAVGSTCLITGLTTNTPTGLGQSFHHFTVNCTLGASVNCSGNLQTINGDFNLTTNHASNEFRLSTGTAYTLTVGGNLVITDGFLSPASGGSGPCILTVNGNTTINGANSRLNKTGAADVTYNFNGNFTMNAGSMDMNAAGSSNTTVSFKGDVVVNGTILRTNGGTHTIRFEKATGTQTLSWGGTSGAGAIGWNVGNGTSTNTLRLLTNFPLSTSAHTFTVANGATLDFEDKVLSGANTSFTVNATGTLRIGSANGITSGTAASGNVQTGTTSGTRTYASTATYIYTGTVNQATGNGLPATLTGTGKITIENSGTAPNNVVTLTTNPSTTPQLNINSGQFAAGTGQTLNISTGGTVNVTSGDFANGGAGGTINFQGSGTWTGVSNPFNVSTSGGVNFGTGPVTIQSGGVFLINSGGFVNSNAPAYASGSSLQYNTTGTYGRGLEWSTTSGKGYPHHVNISNNTTLNPAGAAAVNASVPFRCGGNLTITSGSNLYMDNGGNNMIEDLVVLGNFNLQGNFSLSQTSGSDFLLAGNWVNNGTGANAFMTGANGRQVEFNGTTAQSIGGTNATVPAFDYLSINNTGADVTSNVSLTVNTRLQMNAGKLIIGNNNVTIGASGLIDLGGVNSYIVTNGTGSVTQNVSGGTDWFPVGPSTTLFGPVTLENSGTGDNISVRVNTAPAYVNAVNDNNQMVNLEWTLNEGTAGGNNIRTTFGWTAASEAAGFDRTAGVYHGNHNGTKYVVRATNATSGTDPYFSLSTLAQPYTGNLSNQRFVVGNVNGILPCFQSASAGDWNTAATWVDLIVPPTDASVCINHAITLAAAPPNPSIVTIGAAGDLSISSGVSLTFEPGGTLTNNKTGLNLTSGKIVFQGGTSTINGAQAMGIYDLELNGNTTLTTIPTINNQLEIKAGGFIISANGPNYGAASTLVYNTGGSYNRSNEWRATSGSGYPANVLVTGNTSLNLDAGTAVARSIQGNMQIDNGSSVSQGASTFNLTVPGNFTLNGAYTQSTAVGGDLVLGGNWNSGASASLTSNNRDVRFNGTAAQTVSLASSLTFGFFTIDNSAGAVSLLDNIRVNTFRVNPGRTFDLAAEKIDIVPGGNLLINGTFNANSGIIEYEDGGNFTNNGTFNRGTSTIDFLGTAAGTVVGTVQTNFHNIRLAPNSGVDFNSGPLRGRVSGTLQMRAGSYVVGNAPIYETGSKLMYSGGGTFNRNIEWDPTTVQKVEVTNNTTLKCGTNGTGFSHVMADSLIIQSGSTFDMTGPNMTASTVVGGNVLLRGTFNLSNSAGGDLQVSGDWNNNGGTFNCNGRLTTFDGSLDASLKGPSATTFCFLTVNKAITKTLTATVPVNVTLAGGTEVRIAGGVFDLNGQTLTVSGASNTLRINAGFANGQTLRTGGSSIAGFNNYTSDGVTTATLGGKVDYSGTSAETYTAGVSTYNLLWNTGGSTKTIPQTTIVQDSLWIAPSTTVDFAATAFNLEARGHVVNQGSTIGSGLGSVILNGTSAQNMSGNGTYRNLDVNKSSNDVNSTGTPTISSKLNVLSGKILQASATDSIILSSTATITETIGAGQHFVRGKLSTTRVVGTSAESFGGMGVSLTAGTNLGTVVATRHSGVALNGEAPCCTGFSTIFRNWIITPTVQPAVADRNLTLTWPSQDDNAMDMVNLQLWKRSSTASQWESIDVVQDVSASNPRVATWSGVSSFSQFTGADLNNPLPLALVTFTGRKESTWARLNWTMTDETGLVRFVLERSFDGKAFEVLTQLNPGKADGQYLYKDLSFRRSTFYRLRMVKADGSSELSQVVLVREGGNDARAMIYPNPSAGSAQLDFGTDLSEEETGTVRIYTSDGKLVLEAEGTLQAVSQEFARVSATLPAGMYQVKVITSANAEVVTFVKQ